MWLALLFLSIAVQYSCTDAFRTPHDIADSCYNYLRQHRCEGTKWGVKYHFYRPSLQKYSADQWLWDSCAHMVVWSHRNATNAVLDFRTLLSHQQPDGRIPEIIFWSAAPETRSQSILKHIWFSSQKATDLTQMPLIAYALRSILPHIPNPEERTRLILATIKYYDWWHNTRALNITSVTSSTRVLKSNSVPSSTRVLNDATHSSNLVWIIHPWESGLDASPAYDEALGFPPGSHINEVYYYSKFIQLLLSYKLRYGWSQRRIVDRSKAAWSMVDNWFLVADVGVNAVYASSWGILADLVDTHLLTKQVEGVAHVLSEQADARALLRHCKQREAEATTDILQHMWDPSRKIFVSLYKDRRGNVRQAAAETAQSLFPLLLRQLPKPIADSIVQTQLLNESRFWTRYPVPSCSKADPRYQPGPSRLMWRGPTWGMVNWLVTQGLLLQGYESVAQQLLDRWMELYEKSGIWEQYNSETGEPYGPEGLGMSTLVVDAMYRLGRL